MPIGFFQPSGRQRRPFYNSFGRKLGYIEQRADGAWFTDVDGRAIARVRRLDLPEATASLCGGTIVTADSTYEG